MFHIILKRLTILVGTVLCNLINILPCDVLTEHNGSQGPSYLDLTKFLSFLLYRLLNVFNHLWH